MDDFETPQVEWRERHALASRVAAELPGLSVAAARAKVAEHPGLSVRFADRGRPVTADFRPGRITAWTVDAVVRETSTG